MTALVVGAGPAGLMAAQELSREGHKVIVADAKPSIGRKFLMAGRSGLNLTMDEPLEALIKNFAPTSHQLRPMLSEFGPAQVQDWARGLGQEVFTGSSGRVFPKAMKASPLLRAWKVQLEEAGVEFRTRWRWTGWRQKNFQFDTPAGPQDVDSDVAVLALGGASWSRLGSDGLWVDILAAHGATIAPFAPANASLKIDWSPHMERFFGRPVKGVSLKAGSVGSRGEFVISSHGLEGGGIYSMTQALRSGAALSLDFLPDWSLEKVQQRLSLPQRKETLSNHIRKTLKLDPAKIALLMEFGRPLPERAALAGLIKQLPITHAGFRPIDQAISTAGGVAWDCVDENLMLAGKPGVFIAGEMLDWEAPTGGYLLTGCLATGKWAGRHAAQFR